MDIVLVTRDRPELTVQTIRSMRENAADWSRHRLLVVFDGTEGECQTSGVCGALHQFTGVGSRVFPVTAKARLGVGGAKNFGADEFSKWRARDVNSGRYERVGELLMFSDNDMYYLRNWDKALEAGIPAQPAQQITQLGGWRHPFHHLGREVGQVLGAKWDEGAIIYQAGSCREVDAVTGNCFVIRWSDWLRYGPFDANAIGPGQSEDFALSQKVRAGGGLVATLDPSVAIHCGLVNSDGEPAVGWREMEQMITEQLAAMPAKERDRVVIMRRAPFAGVHQVPMTGAGRTLLVKESGHVEMEIDASTQSVPAASSGGFTKLRITPVPERRCIDCDTALHGVFYGAGDGTGQKFRCERCHLKAERVSALADKLNAAAVDMGLMRPVDPIPGPVAEMGLRREITVEEARVMYPDPRGPAPEPESIDDALFRADMNRTVHKSTTIGTIRAHFESARELLARHTPQQVSEHLRRRYGSCGLNVGSGQTPFDEPFINIDVQPETQGHSPDIVLEVGREPLPFASGSIDLCVLQHVIEHMGCGESAAMLRECWRVLRSGGSMIVTVPDMRALAGRWLGGDPGMDTQLYMTNVYGAYHGSEHDRHKWGFDKWSLLTYLRETLPGAGRVIDFDWREIAGAHISSDWWILGVEAVKG
jgi:SAM-dependent methyltransferase